MNVLAVFKCCCVKHKRKKRGHLYPCSIWHVRTYSSCQATVLFFTECVNPSFKQQSYPWCSFIQHIQATVQYMSVLSMIFEVLETGRRNQLQHKHIFRESSSHRANRSPLDRSQLGSPEKCYTGVIMSTSLSDEWTLSSSSCLGRGGSLRLPNHVNRVVCWTIQTCISGWQPLILWNTSLFFSFSCWIFCVFKC